MSFTIYNASIGFAKDALNSLSSILTKAASHPNASSFPSARLYEDMLPLSFQVYTVTDTASKIAARTTGVEPPKLERDLDTFDKMHARIEQVREILNKVERETVEKRAAETVTLGLGPGKNVQIKSEEYVQGYGQPNMFFHLNMAYAILRNQGVPLGKNDYLGSFLEQYTGPQ